MYLIVSVSLHYVYGNPENLIKEDTKELERKYLHFRIKMYVRQIKIE